MNKKFKRIITLLLMLLMFIPLSVFADSNIKLWVNGDYVKSDVEPVIEDSRTLVPIRVITENLGYKVDWNADTKEVSLFDKDNNNYIFTIGQKKYTFGTDITDIDVAPKIINDRTFVPLRTIAEVTGNKVDWDSNNRVAIVGDGYVPTALPAVSQNTFKEAVVKRVIDGDTIELTTGEKVRLILVDTPETKHPTKEVQYFGKEASDYTTKALTGKTVYLQKDVSETDRYGRLLRYVWLQRPTTDEPTNEEIAKYCFNSLLLENGYAKLATFPPDIKYVDFFRTREQIARNNNYGLWGNGGSKVVEKKAPTSTKPAPKKAPTVYNEPVTGVYVGNSNTGKFHRSSCSSAQRISPKNRVGLSSRQEAINQGYVPCKRCNP